MSWFKRLKDGLNKTSDKISTGLRKTFQAKRIDDDTLEALEELLITSDFGVEMTAEIITVLSKEKLEFPDDVAPDMVVKQFLKTQLSQRLEGAEKAFTHTKKPEIVLMVGVNGTGKTTTIGKLAHHLKAQGKTVGVAACDTFRAAAVEQLKTWADRTHSFFYPPIETTDPAAVAFHAVEQAIKDKCDVLFIDTAGRLQNKDNLMAELAKIHRVLDKALPGAPHQVLLSLDATVGQNALAQLKAFHEITPLSGLIVTKLDGTAKGGILLPLYRTFKTPIHAIGIGEGLDDLRPFKIDEYLDALLEMRRSAP
ncbi:signal recognition particle-docking protein FtsY [Alphaproteobacteria bacterium]|nr:signal recognition particle-docking protein FtsY [Alphaproteobacteria bacterium]